MNPRTIIAIPFLKPFLQIRRQELIATLILSPWTPISRNLRHRPVTRGTRIHGELERNMYGMYEDSRMSVALQRFHRRAVFPTIGSAESVSKFQNIAS